MRIVSILFNFNILVLFCQICHFLNLHRDHKVLLINDKEMMQKEILNYSIEPFQKQLNKKIDEIRTIKKIIENEMDKLNKNFDKVYDEITQYFKDNKNQIKENEEDIVHKFQLEVTKIKAKLENFMSECNNAINFYEKINKILKPINKGEENNIYKKMIYISKINENLKKIDTLKNELMKNININFIKEGPNIKFEEYYFNGIPTPNKIEFKDINSKSIKLFWNLDNINIINFDLKNLKSIVELRQNPNEKFIQVYEGIDKNYLITKLNKNTNYEIRICFKYNDTFGPWSEIHKIKTNDIIYNYPINPKSIKIKNNGKEYILISHRYYGSDKISQDKTKLFIHNGFFLIEKTKWLLIPDENNLMTIKCDCDSFDMMNWEIYSEENNVLLCKNLSSKFEVIMINEAQFYIRDVKSGKYFWNSLKKRDLNSYYIELNNFDENEKERFIFYT